MSRENMSQIELTCPRCQEQFKASESEVYECPKCGSTVRAESDTFDQDKTQIFKV